MSTGPQEQPDPTEGWDTIPLFMQSLPEDGKTSEALEALQALAYEDSVEQVAQDFKKRGNESFAQGRFKEAESFYTQALDHAFAIENENHEVTKDPGLTIETKRVLLCNRAACNLRLQNYGRCIRDCGSVIDLQPSSTATTTRTETATTSELESQSTSPSIKELDKDSRKALFRATHALVALNRMTEAVDSLQKLIEATPVQDRQDSALTSLQETITKQLHAVKRSTLAQEQRRVRKERNKLAVNKGLSLRGWKISKQKEPQPPPADIEPPHFDRDSLIPQSDPETNNLDQPYIAPDVAQTPLVFPVFVLRPCSRPPTRDLIAAFHEDTCFSDQLEAMFGQDDPEIANNYLVYVVTKNKRILKLGRQLTLRQAAQAVLKVQNDGLALLDGWVAEFYVVPPDQSAEWTAQMKKNL